MEAVNYIGDIIRGIWDLFCTVELSAFGITFTFKDILLWVMVGSLVIWFIRAFFLQK